MPPTSREMAAIPPSRIVIVLSVDVAAETMASWVEMEKSASSWSTIRCRVESAALTSWYAADSSSPLLAAT